MGAKVQNSASDQVTGENFSFADGSDYNVSSGYIGVSLNMATNDNFSIITDVEIGEGSGEEYANGNIGLLYRF